jgi:hypothetical protein
MLQMLHLPDWLPWWVPLALLVPASLWALSFLFMPFSVFGVKSRLEVIEGRLEEIQNDLRHMAGRFPAGIGPVSDYEEVFPPRLHEPRADRITTRPPIPPARHDLYSTSNQDRTAERPGDRAAERQPPERYAESNGEPAGEPALEDRPPPSPNARPVRRNDPVTRTARAEPRLDWRR